MLTSIDMGLCRNEVQNVKYKTAINQKTVHRSSAMFFFDECNYVLWVLKLPVALRYFGSVGNVMNLKY
jgi:hypothetical protein